MFLTPVLSPPAGKDQDPERLAVFANAKDELIPDPAVYSDWFDAADERRRRIAVGSRRYSAVEKLGLEPTWEHFLEPETGRLLSVAELHGESAVARGERVAKVRAEIARRRSAIEQLSTYGFEP